MTKAYKLTHKVTGNTVYLLTGLSPEFKFMKAAEKAQYFKNDGITLTQFEIAASTTKFEDWVITEAKEDQV